MRQPTTLTLHSRIRALVAATAGALLALGLGASASLGQTEGEAPSETSGIPELTLGAVDYAFEWPESVPAGRTAITMDNAGQDLHHGYLVKLNDGVSAEDLVPLFDRLLGEDTAAFAELFSLVSLQGGAGIIVPGASQRLILDLEPGTYVWFCGLPAADGEPHFAKGMITTFEVTANETGTAPDEPDADGALALQDFAFALPGSIAPGEQLWKVSNEGQQPHEFLIAQLAPGATALDFAMAFGDPAATEPPPGLPVGGLGPVDPGSTSWLGLDLAPGTYAAFCLVPDPESGQPHLALGMVTEFTVEETTA